MKFYLAGQNNFGNRGCEALVRSIVHVINSRIPNSTFVCPSNHINLDKNQWPDSIGHNVVYSAAPIFPEKLRWWGRITRFVPSLGHLSPPKCKMDISSETTVISSNAVIVTGGDVISLDYGVPSLYFWSNFVDRCVEFGLPTFLWAASVGPFSSKPSVEKEMIRHLSKYSAITVRETASYDYLNSLGLTDVHLVSDPAFTLDPEYVDINKLGISLSGNVIGLNVSPLIRLFRHSNDSRNEFDVEIVEFVRDVVKELGMSVLLIPHVDPLDGSSINSDHSYMSCLIDHLDDCDGYVKILPRTLNAAQLKFIISKCRFFIGARTHSTIAAMSMGVPTISIAYSVKAKGINYDIFGSEKYVLDTPLVSRVALRQSLELLLEDESAIKSLLKRKLPSIRQNSYKTADILAESLYK